ncbi:MAG: UDP-N-acetylmuramoyl-tripeptide--D-alanyl-D-alanine ligase [Candidatus Pacebacteria bacterium]|nr:UDP-N-acetylmuramoyl-tripeptide--D-alanyl-D-alanine ligase [Candidatus Paceibacterota bacterium]
MKSFFKKIIVVILRLEATLVLKKYRPKIIAVTGSVGKTSTKDAIFSIMSAKHFVRKSEKSFNSDIGVPLTILGCSNAWNNPLLWTKNIVEGFLLIALKNHYPKWLVLEVGADRPGDIQKITEWLKPDAVVVTALPEVPVHVEYFDSPEEVVREKEYLVDALKPEGTLILNGDDPRVMAFREKHRHATTTFGFEAGATFLASHETYRLHERLMTFRVDSRGSSVPVVTHDALGRQHIYPILAAFAVGSSFGLDMATMADAAGKHKTPAGRMKVLEGVRKSVIIDDSYNSSPAALSEGLTVLRKLSVSGRKFAVLGDMLELGSYSVKEHRKIGEMIPECADRLITVGIRARDIMKSAIEHGFNEQNALHFDNATQAGEELARVLEKGDVAFIKGSQSIRLEKAVKAALADPKQAPELLVRQEAEWLKR